MSENWVERARVTLLNRDADRKSAEDAAEQLVRASWHGNTKAEIALCAAAYFRRASGMPNLPIIDRWLYRALMLRFMANVGWNDAFKPDALKSAKRIKKGISPPRHFARFMRDADIVEAVEQAVKDGFRLSDPGMSVSDTAFNEAAKRLLDSRIGLSATTVRDRYYKAKKRRR